MRRRLLPILAVAASLAGGAAAAERSVELTETVRLALPREPARLRIWVPVPVEDAHQKTEILEVSAPCAHALKTDPDFGNRLLYFEPGPRGKEKEFTIRLRYRITRQEQTLSPFPKVEPSGYLESRGLERVNEEVRRIAQEATAGLPGTMEKARALYDYVLSHMRYDKSGTGWGRGDAAYACSAGRGNCSDFHALFIALARAAGIPARFRMGYVLAGGPEGKLPGGYHCWAEFYVRGRGWLPVDISEAWKEPRKAEYFFGRLDPDRVLLSTGREIVLEPRQEGPALNFLSEPYIELDGAPWKDFTLERSYRNVFKQPA